MERRDLYTALGFLAAGILIGLIIYYIATFTTYTRPMYYGGGYGSMGPGMPAYGDGRYYPPGCCQGPASFTTNGERIYYTGINENGERIPFTGGPNWLIMHGGSCVNCHGRDGRGNLVPMMCSIETPDIRYTALRGEQFDVDAIKKAITKGIDEKGEALDYCMPRWHMSEKDLNDTVEYLKKLG